jgi:hypothetical protein
MKWQFAIGMCACLYSTCSVLMFAQESTFSSSHYHVSFLVLFTALVVLLYAH